MADVNLGTYSPEEINFIISIPETGQSYLVTGYMDGTFLNIQREVPLAELYVGADNTGARTVRTNRSATISLSLHQSSPANDVLTQLYLNDQDEADGTWLFNVLIKDDSGRSLYQGNQCFIMKLPDSGFSTSIESREWMFQIRDLEQRIGGNAKFDPTAEQAIIDLGGTPDPNFASGA